MRTGIIFFAISILMSFSLVAQKRGGTAKLAKDFPQKPAERTTQKSVTQSVNTTTYELPPTAKPASIPGNKPVIIKSPSKKEINSPTNPIKQPIYTSPLIKNSDVQAQQFKSGFSEGFNKNEAKGKELDEELSRQYDVNDATEDKVNATVGDTFSRLFAREKEEKKVNITCKDGKGYETTLFQDPYVTVKYNLVLMKGPIRCDKYVDTRGDVVPFCGFYYKATCTIINRQHKKLFIEGSIHGSPGFEAKKHISLHGEIAKDFGFDKDPSSFWHLFYYSWNFTLMNPEFSQTNYFWTEFADEKPAWTFNYKIMK